MPQVSGVPVHLSSFRPSHSPTGLYNDCKGSEVHGPLKGTQTSPIPGLADQVSVSGRSSSEYKGRGRPNPVLGLDNKSGEIQTKAYSGVFVCGLRIPSRFSPCKTHSREMAQISAFDPNMSQVKKCFDCKMFAVANNGLLASMEKMVPGGRFHMMPLQFHLKEHSVFALVKNECETDCFPSLEKARQLSKIVRHVLRQDILKYLVPIWDCIESSLFK